MTKTTGNFTDFLDFSRNSKGTALRRIAYGSELVTNGTFDSDYSGWNTLNTNATNTITWNNGAIDFVCDGSVSLNLTQSNVFTVGKLYQLKIDVTVNAGDVAGIKVQYTGTDSSIGVVTATGSYTFNFVAGGVNLDIFRRTSGSATNVTIDNVSVKEVTLDAPSGDLVLFNHPNNVPRVEYDADGNVKGLLIEESRTNLVRLGEVTATSGLGWADSSSVSTNLNENALGMFQGVSIASSGQTWHRRSIETVSVTSGNNYAATVFYRAGTSNRIRIVFRNNVDAQESRVTGEIGSLTASASAAGAVSILSEEDLPDNVKKITIKFVPNFTGAVNLGIGPDSSSSGETVIAYAAQLEAGRFATSYIPTVNATATRNADICSLKVDSFGWHGGEAGSGTVVFEAQSDNWQHNVNNAYARVLEFDGHGNNGIYRAAADGDGDQFRYRLSDSSDGGAFGPANIGAATASITDGAKVALAYAPDDFAIAANGASPTTDTSGTFDTLAVTTISIGKSTGNSNFLNGYLKSFQYYPRRLTDAQLQELTS